MVHAVGVLIIRLWAAHVFVQALFDLQRFYPVILSRLGLITYESDFSIFFPLSFLALLLLSLAMFLLAKPLVRMLMPEGPGPEAAGDADRLIDTGTGLIGLYYVAQFLPFLLGAAVAQSQLETRGWVDSIQAEILMASIITVIALCLMFRLRHLRQLRREVNSFILKSFTPRPDDSQKADS